MKLICWNCRGLGNPISVRELKQLLDANNPDLVFLCEMKLKMVNLSRIQNICRMNGGLVVNAEGWSGGLALLWKEDLDISIQTYSKHHTDSLVRHRLRFKYDNSRVNEVEAKNIIKTAWSCNDTNIIEKFDRVRANLGEWQRIRYSRMKKQINKLETKINKIIDGTMSSYNANYLKEARSKLSHMYEREECYWAQRSRIKWLREGDRNIRYFHVRATSRQKKNRIEKLKDSSGNWVYKVDDFCKVAVDYFQYLFKFDAPTNGDFNMNHIQHCITQEINNSLRRDFTEGEILEVFKKMDPKKAPGIAGLSGSFFKNNWDVVDKEVVLFCLYVLKGNKDVKYNDPIVRSVEKYIFGIP
ncbi:hypothetical protein J1N35_000609 [Gossypium stocksii]|uniref:Endonuclease/exonuclease/phosphatase domain-containing protein n=1 Tax=Gossypium stocksii TaxID=47602 RepID=A0A9D3WIP1_9ROSI|nr:hypothetical protein J1N35_000609 [Gossypium stocksii]